MDVMRVAVRQDPRALEWVDDAMVRHHYFYEWLLEEVSIDLMHIVYVLTNMYCSCIT